MQLDHIKKVQSKRHSNHREHLIAANSQSNYEVVCAPVLRYSIKTNQVGDLMSLTDSDVMFVVPFKHRAQKWQSGKIKPNLLSVIIQFT